MSSYRQSAVKKSLVVVPVPTVKVLGLRHIESVKTVQARLGHASATETLDTYSDQWPDNDDRTREAVDSVLGAEILADCVRTTANP